MFGLVPYAIMFRTYHHGSVNLPAFPGLHGIDAHSHHHWNFNRDATHFAASAVVRRQINSATKQWFGHSEKLRPVTEPVDQHFGHRQRIHDLRLRRQRHRVSGDIEAGALEGIYPKSQ